MSTKTKPIRLEVQDGLTVALNQCGAFAGVGALTDYFKQHIAGEIKILNITRPDLAEVFTLWKKREGIQ